MNTVKKAAIITAAAGGILAAGMGAANASSEADGAAVGSPGVASGNNIQVPVHIPVNLCGNSINVVGLVNPAFGNVCINHG
ncbi:chaplin [Embleya sp. NPDC008237]|uniref:chaplin n=1 Tax=unclassified Embleya TaxID=2699296 RepID=UPI0036E6A772